MEEKKTIKEMARTAHLHLNGPKSRPETACSNRGIRRPQQSLASISKTVWHLGHLALASEDSRLLRHPLDGSIFHPSMCPSQYIFRLSKALAAVWSQPANCKEMQKLVISAVFSCFQFKESAAKLIIIDKRPFATPLLQ